MLSDTFQTILMKILNNIEIDSNKLERILEYIQTKPIESYVYPEVVEEKLDVAISDCMKVFIYLEKFGVLKQVYKLYCPNCKDFSKRIYENINELEEENECEICGEELFEEENLYKYVVIYFKVISNG